MARLKRIVNLSLVDPGEADREIAYNFLMVMMEMSYKIKPTAPFALKDYHRLSDGEKQKLKQNNEFWNRKDVSSHLDQVGTIKCRNESNLYWLKWALSKIPEADTANREKLETFIMEFECRMKTE